MAFKFETANERWQWFSMGGGSPEDYAREWELPSQAESAIRARFTEGASMEDVKKEFSKFITENGLSDNDIYELALSTKQDSYNKDTSNDMPAFESPDDFLNVI
jgi:hypothetical protein